MGLKKGTLKYYMFLFRWFLIGRNHCNIDPKYKKYWKIIHKILWIIIIWSIVYTWIGVLGINDLYV